MTRKKLLIILCTLLSLNVAATPANDTIVHVQQAHDVLISQKGQTLDVQIQGQGTDSAYSFRYTQVNGKNPVSDVRQRAKSWDFSILMTDTDKKKGSRNYCNMGAIGIGFASAPGAPADMDVDMGSSYEIFCNLLTYNYLSPSRRHSYSFGIGLNWINYRMTGKKRFVKEGTDINIVDYPEGASIDFSRIKVFSLPFTLKYTHHFNKGFNMYAAANLHLNTYASIKTRYAVDGKKHKDISKHIHQRNATVSFQLGATFKSFGLYAKYSPCEVLNSAYAPKFRSFSAGLTFGY